MANKNEKKNEWMFHVSKSKLLVMKKQQVINISDNNYFAVAKVQQMLNSISLR